MPESVLRFQHILFYLYLWLYTNKKCQKSDQSDDLHRKSGYRNMSLTNDDHSKENNKCNTHDNISYCTTIHCQSLLTFQSAESHTLCQTFLYHDV